MCVDQDGGLGSDSLTVQSLWEELATGLLTCETIKEADRRIR